MRLSLEQLVTTPTTLNYLADGAYDYTKWNLGKGIYYDSANQAIRPIFNVIRPLEESTSFAAALVYSVRFSSTYDYIFGVENATGATNTRRIHMWTLNKKTNQKSWNGFITLTLGSATAHTVRDFKIDRKIEITGTASASGTAVTGSGTAFLTNRVAVGARIGFGSTDPSQISTWYRISAIGSDGGLTIATSAGTVTNGAYVIEEYRPVYVATNATTTNGGVHLGKGITPEDFTSGGTTISLAAATDNVKAVYWLKDAATVTNLVAAGMACDFASVTPTNLDAYVVDLVSAGNYKFFKYNLRAALTVASGISTSAFVLATGNNPFTGTGSQLANLCIATANHGTGSGVKSLYLVTTTRVYRVPVTQIVSTSTTVFSSPSDNISEVPPGGATSYTVTGAFASIEYISAQDKFLISTTSIYNYLTQYVSSGTEMTEVWGGNQSALEQTTKNSNIPLQISINAVGFAMNDADSITYMCKNSTTAGIAVIYCANIGAHQDSTGNYSLVTPEISTPNALKYGRAFANHINFQGSTFLGYSTETFRLFARTANIRTDMTTGWTEIAENNDISSFAGASAIQFKIVFKTLGNSSIPAAIYGINVCYEDTTNDSHYALSVAKSDLVNKRFAFWFKTAFGGTVPTLTIRLYDADTGSLLLTDTTATSASGTFEKTTDGSAWTAYNTTDRANSTTWIRYTPSSLADNIKIMAVISQG